MSGYPIRLAPDDNETLLVTCPALPEVTSFGETEADALAHALGAIEEALAARIDGGRAVPAPCAAEAAVRAVAALQSAGARFVALPALTSVKVELYRAMQARTLTRAELARRLDWNRNSVDRLFKLDHASRLDQLAAAAAALGLQIEARLAPAA